MDVIDLGADVDYRGAWALQRRLHEEVAVGDRPATVLLLEHRSVYTAGTSTRAEELPTDGSEAIRVDRGGRITWHGPGQLVAYPIVRLPDAVCVVDWVRRVEEAAIRAVLAAGLPTRRIVGRAGVWVADAAGERKVAQIGVRVTRRTSRHGVSVNVRNSLEPFRAIIPCGIADAGVTTIEAELGRAPEVAEVGRSFAAALEPMLDFGAFDTLAAQPPEDARRRAEAHA